MRAVIITDPGEADALQLRQVGVPVPAAGEVRIRTVAAAVNPVDLLTRQGMFHELGWISGAVTGIGWDIAGYIDAVGSGVEGLAIGTPVAGLRSALDVSLGTYGDALVLPASAVAAMPPGLGFIEAATVPLNALTADQALDLLDLPAGASLLVTGAAGAVGGYAVALAAQRKLQVTALARSGDAAFLRTAGAAQIIDKLAPEQGQFDGVLDAAALVEPALAATREGGRYVGVIPATVPVSPRGISIEAVRVQADGKRLAELLALAANGSLAIRIAGLLPLDQAAEAHRRVEQGGQRGRWVLVN